MSKIDKNSKIFVAGHKGLVGSAILKNLQSKGYTNLLTKTHQELDLTNQKAVEEFFQKEKPHYVILAAAKVGGIVANNTYRADFIYENLQIQNNVIHQSYKNKVKKLLFLGSTCIYPKNSPQPMKEESLLTSELEYTNEPYAIAKIAGIKMCESYNLQYGTNFISLMPTNLYGKNDNFDLKTSHVLPALLRKMYLGSLLEKNDFATIKKDLNGIEVVIGNSLLVIGENSSNEEILKALSHFGITQSPIPNTQYPNTPITDNNSTTIEIWGSGKPRREFMYSEDMADACVYILENIDFKNTYDKNKKEIRNTHINIGTGVDLSIKELAELIRDVVGFSGKLTFNEDKPDGTMLKLTDVVKLKELDWEYKVKLKEGIRRVYKWYAKRYK